MELKAIQLTKQYGSKTAVNHLNLSLSNGVYGLLGANGAGKTTLMRLLCDIQTPTSGKITLDGKNISVLGEKYRNLLGYLPQQFGYYPDFTAWDFLMYVAALKGLSEKQAHKKATELLEAVDLAEKRNLKIKTFSGGMKQRLGIAQAMLNNPRILILDEPTARMRRPPFKLPARSTNLPVAGDDIFVRAERVQPHRSSGMKFLGGNSHFAPQAEFAAVRKSGGYVHIDCRTVCLHGKDLRMLPVLCDDCFAVSGGML